MSNIPLIQSNYSEYPETIKQLKRNGIDFPRNVSIETQVKCNANCSFCAYPVSPRQGQKMQREMFLKIIDDLTDIPQSHHFRITLHRLSEPLLDSRLQDFHEVIAEKLPSAFPDFWSNGTMMQKGTFEWMAQYLKGSLTVSLNSVNEEEHASLMGFGVKKLLPQNSVGFFNFNGL